MTSTYNIRGTWVSFETKKMCLRLKICAVHLRQMNLGSKEHLEFSSFLQVSMDTLEAKHVQNLQFLIDTERSLVRHRNFSIM